MIKLGVNTVLFAGTGFKTAANYIKWAGYDALEISDVAFGKLSCASITGRFRIHIGDHFVDAFFRRLLMQGPISPHPGTGNTEIVRRT